VDKTSIKRLLVPLDGSPMAESVLPLAVQLARKISASVTLVHVVEKDPPEKIHGQRHLTNSNQAEDYLRATASSVIFEGVNVNFHVHEAGVRDVSQSISDHTEELKQDIVIMCTHRSSLLRTARGLRGMLFGTIAQQVISFGNVPVLLVNPSSIANRKLPVNNYTFENFLVPLDGNPDHEQSLAYASMLAKMCGARIHLLIAIPQFGTMSGEMTQTNRLLPGTTAKMMDMIVPDAEKYLSQLQTRIAYDGIEVTTSTSRNKPDYAIPKTAKAIKADLIILATHGKRGAEAFWDGSVTPKISKSSRIPLLLVPVKY
jgi:nucleotide-binding universal stress UspA family protein